MQAPEVDDVVDRYWEEQALPALAEYVREPALSPSFEPDWVQTGSLRRAAEMLAAWLQEHLGAGEVVSPEHGPPCVLAEIPATGPAEDNKTVLFYGHYDKQPDCPGWSAGLAAYEPVRRDDPYLGRDSLYGRGAADNGWAPFAAAGAVLAARAAEAGHPRVVVLLEGGEESGSPDLGAQLGELRERIGGPDLVVTLDSSCVDYRRLWISTSARGVVTGTIRVQVLEKGMHSGHGGGVVPSSFRILRQLLSRVEDEATGDLAALQVEVPADRRREMHELVEEQQEKVLKDPPTVSGLGLEGSDTEDRLERQTWRPSLEIVGIGGVPAPSHAGNVLRAATEAKFSVRLPPTLPARQAFARLKAILEDNPPYGAEVTVTPGIAAEGWNAPDMPAWLAEALDSASRARFGAPAGHAGEGGSNPFLGPLAEHYPDALAVGLGLYGPRTGHHGPDERLDVDAAKRITACLADLLAAHARQAAG